MALNPKNWTLKTQEAVAAAVDQAKALSNPELTPDHLLAAIVRQDNTVVPAVLAKLRASGLEPAPNSPAELARFIDQEREKWAGIVKKSGAKAD